MEIWTIYAQSCHEDTREKLFPLTVTMSPQVLSALGFLIMLFSFGSTSAAGLSAMGFGASTGFRVRVWGIYEHNGVHQGEIFYKSEQT